jgi:LEA14-like dessication related protein
MQTTSILRRPFHALAGLMAAWLLFAVSACSTLGDQFETPDLSLVSIQMLSTDMFAQHFKVRVLVKNPNDIELPIRGLDYQIFLMGDSFAEGMSSDRFVVPPRGEAEFDMAITTNFVSSLGRLVSRVSGGKLENLDYEIVGKVLLDKGVVRKIPFNKRGKVNISKALGAKPGEV